MKVLFFAPYIYDPRYPAFSRTSSGFGYMVNDILREVSQKQETYLLTHQFVEAYMDTYTACKHTRFDFLKGIRFGNLVSGLKLFFTPKKIGLSDISYVVVGQLAMFLCPSWVVQRLSNRYLRTRR